MADADPSWLTRARHSAVWASVQTVSGKVASTVAQLILGALLSQAEFGTWALASSASILLNLAQLAGVRELLVQSQDDFERRQGTAFWLALALGLLGMLATLALAPLAATVVEEPRIVPLLQVIAVAAPLEALATVPFARLQRDLEFRIIARTGIVAAWAAGLTSVIMAYFGAGVYSLALPRVLVALIQMVVYWRSAASRTPLRFDRGELRAFVRPSALLFGSSVAQSVMSQIDYFLLGILCSTQEVGLYYFAFGLSVQVLQLVNTSLAPVLIATFSRLREQAQEQIRLALRAARLLCAVGTPLCFAQAAAARPLVQLLFGHKWDAAIPALEILSIGMAFMLVTGCSSSLLQAQGRFSVFMRWTALGLPLFGASVALGAALGGAHSVAIAVVCFYAFYGPGGLYMSAQVARGSLREIVLFMVTPMALSAAAWAVSRGFMRVLGGEHWPPVAALAFAATGVVLVYAVLLKLIVPAEWSDLKRIGRSFIPSRRASPAS